VPAPCVSHSRTTERSAPVRACSVMTVLYEVSSVDEHHYRDRLLSRRCRPVISCAKSNRSPTISRSCSPRPIYDFQGLTCSPLIFRNFLRAGVSDSHCLGGQGATLPYLREWAVNMARANDSKDSTPCSSWPVRCCQLCPARLQNTNQSEAPPALPPPPTPHLRHHDNRSLRRPFQYPKPAPNGC